MASKKPKQNSTDRIISKLDDLRDETVRLRTSFEAHLKQDEQFYTEVRDIVKGQGVMADRLGDYNTQLQIHIAGVNELKEQTKIMRDERELIRAEYNARLKLLEEEYQQQQGRAHERVSLKERLQFWMAIVGGLATAAGAIFAAAKWLLPLLMVL